MSWSSDLAQMEKWLVSGEFDLVHQKLKAIKFDEVPTDVRLRLAAIYRRCGTSSKAIKLLAPAIQGCDVPPTQAETVEYCLNLLNLDLHQEVYDRLIALEDNGADPSIFLYRASCQVSQWNYREAIPHFLDYIENVSGYMNAVGKVNLASCYLFEGRHEECQKTLFELKSTCLSNDWKRLLMNCIDIEVQFALATSQWGLARKKLTDYQALLTDEASPEYLYWRKADVTVRSHEGEGAKPILELKAQAAENAQWEIVRSLDYQLVKIGYGNHTADYLFYGTPYPAFREKFLSQFKNEIHDYFYMNGERSNIFDLQSGELNGDLILKPDQALHRLLKVMLDDFYRPVSVGNIFSKMYSDQFFDPFSSAAKVHQLMRRLRKWIDQSKMPLVIEKENELFRITIHGDLSIRKTWSELSSRLSKLQHAFGEESFSVQQAADALSISRRFAAKLLSQEAEVGSVTRIDSGKRTLYRFAV